MMMVLVCIIKERFTREVLTATHMLHSGSSLILRLNFLVLLKKSQKIHPLPNHFGPKLIIKNIKRKFHIIRLNIYTHSVHIYKGGGEEE